jgi:hypothetical protein
VTAYAEAVTDPYLPLGEPPRHDVDGAARLLVRYQDAELTGPEFGELFWRMVDDPRAVIARADDLRDEQPPTLPTP